MGGYDLLCGGNGNDTVSGGRGADSLGYAIGNDRLTGRPSADRFSGGSGTDAATDSAAAEGDTTDGKIPWAPNVGVPRRRAGPADRRALATGSLTGVALGQDARIGSAVVLTAPRRARVLGGCAPASRHADQGGEPCL